MSDTNSQCNSTSSEDEEESGRPGEAEYNHNGYGDESPCGDDEDDEDEPEEARSLSPNAATRIRALRKQIAALKSAGYQQPAGERRLLILSPPLSDKRWKRKSVHFLTLWYLLFLMSTRPLLHLPCSARSLPRLPL